MFQTYLLLAWKLVHGRSYIGTHARLVTATGVELRGTKGRDCSLRTGHHHRRSHGIQHTAYTYNPQAMLECTAL